MRIFICEYTTGGGLQSEGLPPSLAREGEMMLAALVSDLSTVPGKDRKILNEEIIVSRDPCLTPPPLPANFVSPEEGEDIWEFWGRQIEDADAFWPLAPETGGAMERLCHMAKERRRILLACDAETVRITASKRATATLLSKGGVAVVPVHEAGMEISPSLGGWVVKPDDGAGAQDTRILQNKKEVRGWLAEHPNHITQPYIEGEVASLSLLCLEGRASLLCCNRQIVTIADGEICLQAIEVGGMEQHREAFAALGDSIAALLPSLWGYNGVDVICGREGIIVLEINPRLTTSYVGLGESLGVNPAGLVLDLLSGGLLGGKPLPVCRPQKTVIIEMNPVKMAEPEDE